MHSRQSFHFQKIPQGLNINIFCENLHEASFYIKKQVHIFFSFKNLFLPLKKRIFGFLKKTPHRNSGCFHRVSALS